MSVELGKIKISKICEDKRLGTWWAVGTRNQWLEIRITKAGKIKPGKVKKGTHPYFTKEDE